MYDLRKFYGELEREFDKFPTTPQENSVRTFQCQSRKGRRKIKTIMKLRQ
jgi:hypothetical protein